MINVTVSVFYIHIVGITSKFNGCNTRPPPKRGGGIYDNIQGYICRIFKMEIREIFLNYDDGNMDFKNA